MKKITAIFAACVCLCLTLAACSGDSSSSSRVETSAPDAVVESSQADESSETETTPVTTPEESSEPEETTTEETTTEQEDLSSQEDSSEVEIKLPVAEDLHTMAIDIISDAHNNHATIKDGVYKNGDGSILSNAIDANLDDRGYTEVEYEVEVTGEKVTKVSINGEETLY